MFCGKKAKKGELAAIALAGTALVAVIVAGFFYFNARGKRGPAASLEEALSQWTAEWKNGDNSSLAEGMLFGTTPPETPEETEDGALSAEALKAILEEQYSGLIDPPAEQREAGGLFPVLMPYTEVSYTLPDRVEEGSAVTFEITGPDLASALPLLEEEADQEALLRQLDSLLAAGNYETRTVTATAAIEALDDGYRLQTSYALVDGLYGGALGIVGSALPTAG